MEFPRTGLRRQESERGSLPGERQTSLVAAGWRIPEVAQRRNARWHSPLDRFRIDDLKGFLMPSRHSRETFAYTLWEPGRENAIMGRAGQSHFLISLISKTPQRFFIIKGDPFEIGKFCGNCRKSPLNPAFDRRVLGQDPGNLVLWLASGPLSRGRETAGAMASH